MASAVPKAALYISRRSVWASVPLLALEEKGYGEDEVDIKEVDIAKGENFALSYLRLNPNGTVPTLVVPLEKTLGPDTESRYKAIQDTQSIVEFLDKSRSVQSRTHTTSSAPSPSLAPATISFADAAKKIIEILHSHAADPNALFYMNARTEPELVALGKSLLPFVRGRYEALGELLADADSGTAQASEKTKAFWEVKKLASSSFLRVFGDAEKPNAELDDEGRAARAEYLKTSNAAWVGLKDVLLALHKEIIGPYTLGDQVSVADVHFAAWLARVVRLVGGTASDDGNTIVAKLEARVGDGFSLPKDFSVAEARRRAGLPPKEGETTDSRESRFAAFWDAIKERPSWKKVYGDELH